MFFFFLKSQKILDSNIYILRFCSVYTLRARILKINMQLKPEAFLVGFKMQQKELEKTHGILFLYMIAAVRLLQAQRRKDSMQSGGMVGEDGGIC